MDEATVARINALARKQREEGLTPDEAREQQRLRRAYLDAYRRNLEAQLEQITVVEPDGTRRRVQKRRP